ncbi:hypothetical protein [Aquimarina longa]|uniref:hypothetical protein n=1 Tax=Aquimarina longa TaxID=1080221 RepID=UPI000A65C42A|nr:hypothetical protein [Aquimarina longa]
MMNKIVLLTALFLVTCRSNSQKEIEFTTKKLDLPLKILHGTKKEDSTFIYLCFPKTIIINNPTKYPLKIDRYKVGLHPKGINYRHYRIFKYKDSLYYENEFLVKPMTKDSFNTYYGYQIKLKNEILDSLINNKVQEISKFKIYNIPINNNSKKWAISKISDSLKGKLHFSLHNKEKGFFYKSLDIELFDD